MWKSKNKDGNTEETDYAFKSRQEYCYYISENPSERKTIVGFLEYCDKRIASGKFTGPKKPSENTIRHHWFKKWKWEKSAKQYMKDNVDDTVEYAQLIYDVNTLESSNKLMNILDKLYDELEDALDDYYEDNNEKHLVITKIINEIDSLEKLIRLKLDKSVNNTQTKNNVEMKHEGLKRLADAFK